MKCFEHRDRDAVAACTYCSKGLCGECAKPGETWIACGPRCDDELKVVRGLVHSAGKGYAVTAQIYFYLGGAALVVGAGATLLSFTTPDYASFEMLIALGLACLVLGGFFILFGRRLRALATKAPPSGRAP